MSVSDPTPQGSSDVYEAVEKVGGTTTVLRRGTAQDVRTVMVSSAGYVCSHSEWRVLGFNRNSITLVRPADGQRMKYQIRLAQS